MRHFSNILILILFFSIWMIPLELGSSWWIENHGDPLDRASRILKAHTTFGWIQKENYEGIFFKKPLETNFFGLRTKHELKPNKKIKTILLLGPSSAFGWGVDEESTYAKQLEKNLQQITSTRVINASIIGFSSFQGNKLAKQLIPLIQPDIVLVAYGVNDLDRHRFYFQSDLSDAKEFINSKTQDLVNFINLSDYFSFPHLLIRSIGNAKMAISCNYNVPLNKRVSENEFVENIDEIQKTAQSVGAKSIILSTPYFLPRFNSINDKDSANALFQYENGISALKLRNFNEAERYFSNSIKLNAEQNEAYYMRATARTHLKMCAEAKTDFDLARASEPKRISRDIDAYNYNLKQWAQKSKSKLIDLTDNLTDNKSKDSLFVDPIHPSEAGHKIISELLFKEIIKEKL